MKSFSIQLQSLIKNPDSLSLEGRKVLLELRDYLMQFPYKQAHSKEVVSNFIFGVSDEETATLLGLSQNHIRIVRQKSMKAVQGILGEDFLDLLEQSSPSSLDTCRSRMSSPPLELKSLLLPQLWQLMQWYSTKPSPDFRLRGEHMKAVKELSRYSVPHLEDWVKNLDPELLGYLCSLISGDGGSFEDRQGLANALSSRSS